MTFRDLNLSNPLWNALDEAGLVHPTSIQQKAFPAITSGRDVLGIAQTGTGKTIAFLLPLLKMWSFTRSRHPQILIVVPTRELVVQIVEVANLLAKNMNAVVKGVYGGTNLKTQAYELAEGADLLVGTPGRLLDLAYHGTLNLRAVKKLVIDEVDEMLALGFRKQLTDILELLPEKRQNLLFSATLSEEVDDILSEHFNDPEVVEAAPPGTPLENITQLQYRVPNFNTKVNLLGRLLADRHEMDKVLVFVSTKALADTLFEKVVVMVPGMAGIIHSNKDQNFRFNAVRQFKEGATRVLIATDIIARGIDVEDVSYVVNFDLPEEPRDYIHRIGRTGRAGKQGQALSLVSDFETERLAQITAYMDSEVPVSPLPDGLVISEVLTESEMPEIKMKNVLVKTPALTDNTGAFHEKKAKNLKKNIKVSHRQKMMEKYGKPKTRGQKQKRK